MIRFLSKHHQKIFGAISILGLFILLGTVGTMDYAIETGIETMTFTESIVRSIIGLIMFGGGARLSGVMEYSYNYKEESEHNNTPHKRKIKGSKRFRYKSKHRSA